MREIFGGGGPWSRILLFFDMQNRSSLILQNFVSTGGLPHDRIILWMLLNFLGSFLVNRGDGLHSVSACKCSSVHTISREKA